MSTYAIGDLQGCYTELQLLLDEINFDVCNDQLWFAGDLVNRGPDSLKCLRFVKSLENNAKVVLGNHDLHLLAVAEKVRKPHRNDMFDEILNADDVAVLLNWIKQQPLLVHDRDLAFTMVHAGLPPYWSLEQAKQLANEITSLLQCAQAPYLLKIMYGDQPDVWSERLKQEDRYRYIVNCFTRIRYLTVDGKLDLQEKNAPGTQAKSLWPWYTLPNRKTKADRILFGHWASVMFGDQQNFKDYNVYPLDSGCVWGGALSALRLEDQTLFSVPATQSGL